MLYFLLDGTGWQISDPDSVDSVFTFVAVDQSVQTDESQFTDADRSIYFGDYTVTVKAGIDDFYDADNQLEFILTIEDHCDKYDALSFVVDPSLGLLSSVPPA